MKSLKELRTQLGLTQQDLAEYLRVARSNVAKAEGGSRSLPSAALIKVGQIINYMTTASYFKSVEERSCMSESESGWHKANCALRLQVCTYNMAILERRLISLETIYSQNVKLYAVLNQQQCTSPSEEHGRLVRLKRVERKLHESSLLVQENIKERIHMLNAEAQYLNQFLIKNSSDL
jgi:transcriptional regulator with XRE-family HTH domain